MLTIAAICTAEAQTVTPDMLRPEEGTRNAPANSPLRKTPLVSGVLPNPGGPDPRPPALQPPPPPPPDQRAPSRINRLQRFDAPAAAGAGTTGFDSLNRKRAKAKARPGAPRPRTLPGALPRGPGVFVPPAPPPPTFSASAPVVVLPPAGPPPPLSPPPSAGANRAPVSASFAGTYPGAPLRRRLKPDDDPFGAVGFYAGSFLVKPAIDVSAGYDTNPARTNPGRASSFYAIAPELTATSNWSRHALSADLRGTFTGYEISGEARPVTGGTAAPLDIDRPDFNGRVNGRYDVLRDTRIIGEGRARLSTDNPGSPNIQFGLARYPLFLATGATLGLEQDFNRFQVQASGLVDRTQYQNSRLTDGSSSSNSDRNFDQLAGQLRLSYDLLPGVKPFAEATIDRRTRDERVDRSGFLRNSDGQTVRAGSSFEFSRLLIGEASIGYVRRKYEDPRLNDLTGLLTRASLTWLATPLTTVKLITDTSADESPLFGVSGVLTRTYTLEVDHDFRRWLTGIGRFTAGTIDYQGGTRNDKFYSASANLIYKLNREVWLKGEVRHDVLDSNLPGFSTKATVVMLGVRLQR